jgi:hypothetical protein
VVITEQRSLVVCCPSVRLPAVAGCPSATASHTSLAAVFPFRFNLSETRNSRHKETHNSATRQRGADTPAPSDAVMADGKKPLTVSAHSGRATERKRRNDSACLERAAHDTALDVFALALSAPMLRIGRRPCAATDRFVARLSSALCSAHCSAAPFAVFVAAGGALWNQMLTAVGLN